MNRSVTEVLREHAESLMSVPEVVGIAESSHNDEPCVLILVVELTDELRAKLPNELDGYPVVVSESGEIKAL